MAAPAFRNSVTIGTSGNGTSAVMTPPTIVDNDILIAVVYKENVAAVTPPAGGGWTEIAAASITTTVPNPDFRVHVFWKRAASESGNYTFSWTGSVWRGWAIMSISDAVTTEDPIDGANAAAGAGTSTSYVAPTITTQNNEQLLVGIFGSFSGGAWSPGASGMTERVDNSDVISMYTETFNTAGATGSRTITGGSTDGRTGSLISIKSTSTAGGGAAGPTGWISLLGVGI